MENGPRYLIIQIDQSPDRASEDLQQKLRPGDRVVSVWPHRPHSNVDGLWPRLCALLELRHPSWAREGVGWIAGETGDEVEDRRLAAIGNKARFEGGM